MNIIQLKPKQIIIVVIILVIAAVILFMNLPSTPKSVFNGEFSIQNVDHVVGNERYVSTGSLKFKDRQFLLDGHPFRFISGAVHYFRIPRNYWEDILKKAKAAGLNTIDTYVPWNLHEDSPGIYYWQENLDITAFLGMAHKLGLYVILRPGPYICSEWDFGGLPGWLLKDPSMKVRTNYKPYMDAVDKWFEVLIGLISPYQYSKGGPIIAVQVENEFGSYSAEHKHLLFVKQTLQKYGIIEMLLTSDNGHGQLISTFYTDALPTANFQQVDAGMKIFEHIKSLSKDFPLAVMEFWCGWFDHWGKPHKKPKKDVIVSNFEAILKTGASVSLYMFHGGTNFGFMAGANYFTHTNYNPDVTSYDYNAPVSEAGDITELYHKIRELIMKYTKVQPPPVPPNRQKADYGKVKMMSFLTWNDLLDLVQKDVKVYKKPQPMEYLDMREQRHGYGQNYGYVVYRRTVPAFTSLSISGVMQDRMQVVIDGRRDNTVLDWNSKSLRIDFPPESLKKGDHTLDILVENMGRVNYDVKDSDVMNKQRKGITGTILLDDKDVFNWTIYPLTFSKSFHNRIKTSDKYQPISSLTKAPCVLKTDLRIDGTPKDTFLKMEGWGKGIVFVNGINLGRYWQIGPQKTLFVPGVYLQKINVVLVFEEEKIGDYISFIDHPELE